MAVPCVFYISQNFLPERSPFNFGGVLVINYSLCSELLVKERNVPRCILFVDTSIFMTSNSEQREF